MKYDDIKTPNELLDFMSLNMKYGYISKSGKIYFPSDPYFNQKWFDEYILQNNDDILSNLCGTCFDQVEFERSWFLNNGYEFKTIYEMVKLNYENDYPTHTFLVYKDKFNKWNWFENADSKNRGIHSFDSLDELLIYQFHKYLDALSDYNISKEEIKNIIMMEYSKPQSGINAPEYIEYVLKNGNKVNFKEE